LDVVLGVRFCFCGNGTATLELAARCAAVGCWFSGAGCVGIGGAVCATTDGFDSIGGGGACGDSEFGPGVADISTGLAPPCCC
jgi:hypothetical protein